MNLKSARRILQFALPVTLLITSCASGASAAGTANTSAQPPSAETSDAQTIAAEAPDAEAPAAETPATGYTIPADYPNPYEMETYDSVPEYLSERHDDVDYGTIEADVEYYSEIAGDVKYCNVFLN